MATGDAPDTEELGRALVLIDRLANAGLHEPTRQREPSGRGDRASLTSPRQSSVASRSSRVLPT